MKKLIYLILTIFLLAGCDQGVEQISGIKAQSKFTHKESDTTVRAQMKAIIETARAATPIDASEGLGIGVLEKNRTDTQVHVAYYNDTIYEVYNFNFKNGEWQKSDLINRVRPNQVAEKVTYTSKIAELFTSSNHNQLRDTWYVPSNVIGDGTYQITEQYQTNLPNFGKFYEGSKPDGTTDVTITFEGPWEWQRFNAPIDSNSSFSKNEFLEIQDPTTGEFYSAEEVTVWYTLSSTQINAPSTPGLSSPSNGATTGSKTTFNWQASSGGGTITYQLQVDNNSNFSSPSYTQSDLTGTSKRVSGLTHSTTHYWRVRASNEAGASNWSTVRSVYVRPETPFVSATISGGHPNLSMSSAEGATSYVIYREHSGTGIGWEMWAEVETTSYIDDVAQVNTWDGTTPYIRYKVRSKDANGVFSSYSSTYYYSPDGSIQPQGGITEGISS